MLELLSYYYKVCLNYYHIIIRYVRTIIVLLYRLIGLVGRMLANGSGDLGSIPGRVIPKTLKMALDTSLLNTQHYKVRIKGKVEQSKEWSSVLFYTSVLQQLKKEPSGSPRLRSPTLLTLYGMLELSSYYYKVCSKYYYIIMRFVRTIMILL